MSPGARIACYCALGVAVLTLVACGNPDMTDL